MWIPEEQIIEILKHIKDPEVQKDIVSLNMVKDVICGETGVAFTLFVDKITYPHFNSLKRECVKALQEKFGAEFQVHINTKTKTPEQTNPQHEESVALNVKYIIAVASGKGGVGKSTVAANLAVAIAKRGAKVGLLDADIYGPSIPQLFGAKQIKPNVKEENGKQLIIPIERHGVKIISIGLFVPEEQALIWRGPMAASAIKQLVSDVEWGDLDCMIIDMPPGTGDIHLTLAQTFPLSGAVIVTTPQSLALSDVKKAIGMFKQDKINVPLLGIIENMSYFIPEDAPNKKYYIFGRNGGVELAKENNIPLLAQIPIVESICSSGETGNPIVTEANNPIAKAFEQCAERLFQYVYNIYSVKKN